MYPDTPIRMTFHAPMGLWRATDGVQESLELLKGRPVAALCGIGRPEAFFQTLEKLGAEIRERMVYPNHGDIDTQGIPRDGIVVTTEKDAVRMQDPPENVVALEVALKKLLTAGTLWCVTLGVFYVFRTGGRCLAESRTRRISRPNSPEIMGFETVSLMPAFKACASGNFFAESGEQDDGKMGADFGKGKGQFDSGRVGHQVIGDKQIVGIGIPLKDLHGFVRIATQRDTISQPGEYGSSEVQDGLFVIDKKNAFIAFGNDSPVPGALRQVRHRNGASRCGWRFLFRGCFQR